MTDKTILRRALTLGAFIASVAGSGALSAQQKHGDVNRDGVVSALDAQAILTQVVGLPIPPAYVIADGDSNCDAATGALDAQIVLSYVIGLNVSQYCVGQPFGAASVRVDITPTNDTSLLINRGIRLRAVLTDAEGSLIQRPVTWTTSNNDLVTIDSARGDTAWVSNHFSTTGAGDATATITAFADGAQGARAIRVHRSYAGVVIIPQRPDTLRQLNGTTQFSARVRDSLGNLGNFTNAIWSSGNTAIATVQGTTSSFQNITALTMGATFLFAVTDTNPTVRDSVPLTVRLPVQNTCTGVGGTLHGNNVYTTPQVWSPETNPHYLTSTQDFQAGSRLTIEPGTLICTDGGFLRFATGSRLIAIGTAAEPIVFKPTNPQGSWSGIQLGDFTSLEATPPPDTSVLTNVVVERASNGNGSITGRERHVVLLDSVTIRQSWSNGVALMTAGSRMIRSRIDTSLSANAFNYAATVGRGAIEETAIRVGGTSSGIQLVEAGTVRDVDVIGGTTGLIQQCCTSGARLNDVTISGTEGVALQLEGGLIHALSGNVVITGGTGGAFRGQIGNFGHLFADSLSQETLKNNGRDTVFITGGALVGVAQVVRPDLPWVVSQTPTIDTNAVLAPRPGARVLFQNSAMLWFQRGGRMTAVGEPSKFIAFAPYGGSGFGGLRFDSPGAHANPALSPTALSTLTYVRVDSASGQGVNEGFCCFTSAIAGATRHRLELDSVIVRKAHHNAVALNARRSFLRRSWIDTTGTIASSYTTAQPAVVLNDSARIESSLIARSGQNAIYIPGTGARLTNVRVVDSRGVALQADGGVMDSTSIGIRLDSANAYPFHGRIENLGIVAGTAALQTANLLGNTDNRVQITGGALTRDSIDAIPALRWVVQTTTTIDTLARLVAQPGANFAFMNSAMLWFQRGGHLNATGTPASFVRFGPNPGDNFGGLRFDSPGAGPNPALAPTALSTMQYVRVDSASGQGVNEGVCCFSAAIAGATRHRLQLDSVIVHKAMNTAVSLNARQSLMQRSWIDTTGNIGSNYTTTQPAVVLNDSARLESSLVSRSGQTGIYAPGSGARLTNVRVTDSEGIGLQADVGVIDSTTSGVRLDLNAYPFHGRIENLGTVAGTAALQTANLLGNTDNRVQITGGALTRDTVDAIPALRWVVQTTTTIDTLARLVAQPGADITFMNSAMLWFQRGGTLNATGTPGSFVRFRPTGVPGEAFGGLRLDSPGAGPIPALAPTALSTMTYVRVDSASGQGVNEGICCFTSTIAGALRHRLELDSVIVHKAFNTAVTLGAKHSFLRRSWIDTTGNIASLYTNAQPAVVLGDSARIENSLVARSGQTGIYAPGAGALLSNIRVVDSRSVALQADVGTLHASSVGVRLDSANAYPFHGRIDNFGIIARSATLQANLLGNTDNVAVMTGGVLVNDTVTAIPTLRWRVDDNLQFGAGSRFVPQPGALLTFQSSGGMWFRSGATLLALGTAADTIRFRPVPGQTFVGLRFDDTSPVGFPSRMSFVRIDSASGQGVSPTPFGNAAAVHASTAHELDMDNSRVQRSRAGAIYLGAPGSSLTDVVVDTTGVGAGFAAAQSAVALNDGTSATNLLLRRSGHVGLYVDGQGITLSGVQITQAQNVGLWIANNTTAGGSQNLQLSGFAVNQNVGTGVQIDASGVVLTGCDVTNGAGIGIATSTSLIGVEIHDCNILGNTGLGVSNQNTTNQANAINADDNFWGLDGAGAPIFPQVGTPNGIGLNVTVNSIRQSQRIP